MGGWNLEGNEAAAPPETPSLLKAVQLADTLSEQRLGLIPPDGAAKWLRNFTDLLPDDEARSALEHEMDQATAQLAAMMG